jgi:hypothetical protein
MQVDIGALTAPLLIVWVVEPGVAYAADVLGGPIVTRMG